MISAGMEWWSDGVLNVGWVELIYASRQLNITLFCF